MFHGFFIRRNGRTRKYELSDLMPMVNLKPHGVPQFWSQLPFINKPWRIPFKQNAWIYFSHLQIGFKRGWIVHIQDASCLLFRGCCLTTPFRALYKNRTFTPKFFLQNAIGYPMLVFHLHK